MFREKKQLIYILIAYAALAFTFVINNTLDGLGIATISFVVGILIANKIEKHRRRKK